MQISSGVNDKLSLYLSNPALLNRDIHPPKRLYSSYTLAMATIATLDHSNLQAEAFALTFAFPVLATFTIGLRIYSRSLTGTFGYGMLNREASCLT
jgi:hypothetical protein